MLLKTLNKSDNIFRILSMSALLHLLSFIVSDILLFCASLRSFSAECIILLCPSIIFFIKSYVNSFFNDHLMFVIVMQQEVCFSLFIYISDTIYNLRPRYI